MVFQRKGPWLTGRCGVCISPCNPNRGVGGGLAGWPEESRRDEEEFGGVLGEGKSMVAVCRGQVRLGMWRGRLMHDGCMVGDFVLPLQNRIWGIYGSSFSKSAIPPKVSYYLLLFYGLQDKARYPKFLLHFQYKHVTLYKSPWATAASAFNILDPAAPITAISRH